MKDYIVNYRLKGDKNSQIFETALTANNINDGRKLAKQDLEKEYTLVKIRLSK